MVKKAKGKVRSKGQFRILAENIARHEGKKVEVNIAQISEVLKIALKEIAWELEWAPFQMLAFIGKYKDKE